MRPVRVAPAAAFPGRILDLIGPARLTILAAGVQIAAALRGLGDR
jgi:hypothetical protein